jgi:hypothetical protein
MASSPRPYRIIYLDAGLAGVWLYGLDWLWSQFATALGITA